MPATSTVGGVPVSFLPSTRISFLDRLRCRTDGTAFDAAWAEFDAVYAPAILGFACRRGLQQADAEDVKQEVCAAVARQIGHFERRESFRAWLFAIARNTVGKLLDRRRDRPVMIGDLPAGGPAENVPDRDEGAVWNEECVRRQLAWAISRVRPRFDPRTWAAFRATALEGKSTAEVAKALGMTVVAVRIAKCRVSKRLKAVLEEAGHL